MLFDGANYFVVWDDSGPAGGTLKGQFVSPSGALVGSVITICAGTAPDSDVQPMTYNIGFDGTNILAAWADGRNGAFCDNTQTLICELDIYGQFISKSSAGSPGTLVGPNFAINENSDWSDMSTIGIAFDGTNYLVAWNDMTPAPHASNARLYAQLVSTSGSPVGDVISVGSPASNKHRDWPVLAFDGTNYLLTWMYTGNDINHNGVCDSAEGTCFDAYGQFISTAGALQGAPFSIGGGALNQMAYPVFAAGKYLIVSNTFSSFQGGTVGNISGKFLNPRPVIISPNGGESIASGSTYTISWEASAAAVKFKLSYSPDGGTTWVSIKTPEYITGYITDTSYAWTVPVPLSNRRQCLVTVKGYDSNNVLVSSDKSDAPFTIEVVKLTSPNNGTETWASASQQNITWTTNATKNFVAKVKLLYTKDNGITWLPIKTVAGNTGAYSWTVPTVLAPKHKCKVKVVLKNALGAAVGSDTSDNPFTIQQP